MRNLVETPPREAVDQQDTQMLPTFKVVYVYGDGLLTLRQVRERCSLNQVQLAKAANVRPIVVDWFERGRAVMPTEAAQVLETLARLVGEIHTHHPFDLWEGGRR
ncbi:MAG: helix-turn-helix transcriptional regulator [Ktedonobacteraceae bacterium]